VQKLKDKGIEFLHQVFGLFSIDFAGAKSNSDSSKSRIRA